jgi:hypothetical protein
MPRFRCDISDPIPLCTPRIKRNIAGVIALELRDTCRCRDLLHIRQIPQRFQISTLQGIDILDRYLKADASDQP